MRALWRKHVAEQKVLPPTRVDPCPGLGQSTGRWLWFCPQVPMTNDFPKDVAWLENAIKGLTSHPPREFDCKLGYAGWDVCDVITWAKVVLLLLGFKSERPGYMCIDHGEMSSILDVSTSYGYASYASEEDFLHIYRFREIAQKFLQEDAGKQGYPVPEDLLTFGNDLQELKAYGTALCEALRSTPHLKENAKKLRATADRMLCLIQDREPIEDILDMSKSANLLGVMSKAEEAMLKTCLDIYRKQQPSTFLRQDVASMSRSELEEAVINEWRRQAGIRSKLPPGPILPDNFVKVCEALGFTLAKVPDEGLWNYAVITGGTLPRMKSMCLFLQQCITGGVVPEQLIMLASSRPRDSDADSSSSMLIPDDCATEADLAELLRQDFARNSDHGIAELWSSAVVVRTDHPKAGFADTFRTWLQSSPRPGSLLVVSQQPFIRRLHVQASRLLQPTEFRKEYLEVIGDHLSENYRRRKSNVLLDAIAHWVQIQREDAWCIVSESSSWTDFYRRLD